MLSFHFFELVFIFHQSKALKGYLKFAKRFITKKNPRHKLLSATPQSKVAETVPQVQGTPVRGQSVQSWKPQIIPNSALAKIQDICAFIFANASVIPEKDSRPAINQMTKLQQSYFLDSVKLYQETIDSPQSVVDGMASAATVTNNVDVACRFFAVSSSEFLSRGLKVSTIIANGSFEAAVAQILKLDSVPVEGFVVLLLELFMDDSN